MVHYNNKELGRNIKKYYKDFSENGKEILIRKLSGFEVKFERVSKCEFTFSFFEVILKVNEVTGEVVILTKNFNYHFNSNFTRDILSFLEECFNSKLIVVSYALLNKENYIEITKDSIKRYNRKSKEFKELYLKIIKLIPKSVPKNEYSYLIKHSLNDLKKFYKDDKLFNKRLKTHYLRGLK